MDNKFERAEAPDDPLRCQSVVATGQCPYRRMEDSQFCAMHGGNKGQEKAAKENLRNYRLSKWRVRCEELADSTQVKSLREEIGILRILLEETMNKCNDASELLLFSAKISDLVLKIEKVVSSCHRLEQSTGQLLDRSAALNFAAQIISIVGSRVTDVDTLDFITNEILKSLERTTSDVPAVHAGPVPRSERPDHS